MDIEGLLQIIRSRRHNGKVKADPIPDGHLEKILEAASWAPSGNNAQPWEFIVIKSPKTKAKIREIVEGGAHGRGEAPVEPPVIIVACGDMRLKESYPENVNRQEVFYSSVAASIQNLHLAATALGLASNWGTVREASMAPLQELLGLPEGLEIVALIRLGYPQETPASKSRRSVEEVAHYEKFNKTKLRDARQFIESRGKGWGRL